MSQPLNKQSALWFLTLSYTMSLAFANWFDPRIVQVFGLTTDAGTIIFPLTFLLSDLITEVYGYKNARRAIWCGFLFNVLFLIYGLIVTHLPSPSFATQNANFDSLFVADTRVIIASVASYFCAEPLNSYIMSKMKIASNGKYLSLRFVLSTFVASGADSFIFSLIAFYKVFSNKDLFNLAATMWFIKVAMEIIGLPISLWLVAKLKKSEKVDIYDRTTDFNLFKLDTTYTEKENEFVWKNK